MVGALSYSSVEAKRNKSFIEELIHEAKKFGVELQLQLDEEPFAENPDFIIFRQRNPELAARWETEGFRVFNRSEVNRIANHKYHAYELALLLGIPSVPTKKIHSANEIQTFPVVLKTTDGHGGSEVILCKTETNAGQFFSSFPEREYIMQPYIESHATDVRVYMLGNEVLGAVKRIGNSFQSNFTLGGKVEPYSLNSTQILQAETIAKALHSDYIGIDFLLLPDGSWLFNEIEDPVGARSFYEVYDISAARELIMYILESIS